MKSLLSFITESEDKMSPTKEWMREHYELFNKIYFNYDLPDVNDVILIVRKVNEDWLGCQGENIRYYISEDHMENGMYIMYSEANGQKGQYNKGRWTLYPIVDESSRIYNIVELEPYIYLSPKYKFTETEMEDTLIHEMIHLWTFKDGLAPKRAHGKEFKAKCKEIRELAKSKYGKTYHLTTYCNDMTSTEMSDAEKNKITKELQASASKGGGIISLYFTFDPDKVKGTKWPQTDRFLFCTKNMLSKIVDEIQQNDKDKLLHMYVSTTSYEPICLKYGKFSTVRGYRYWDLNNYRDAKEFLLKDATDILVKNESLNESKKPYIKPMINVIEIPAETNMSAINLEDIVNGFKDESSEQTGTKENDNNLITVK